MTTQMPKNLDWYASFENLLGNGFLEDLGLEKLRFGVIHKKVGPFKYGMLIVEFGIDKFNKVGILVTEVTEENH